MSTTIMSMQDHHDAYKLAVSFEEAAGMLGVSLDHFQRHIAAELRCIRSGRRKLVPVSELTRWLEENASRALEGQP
jgi:excisionase family DNA binding protein